MDIQKAIKAGETDGAKHIDEHARDHGVEEVIAALEPDCDWLVPLPGYATTAEVPATDLLQAQFTRVARALNTHRIAGVPEGMKGLYYEAYEHAARARAEWYAQERY